MTGDIDLVILAGGAATRLGALAATTPKSLLPVASRPFLAYAVAAMARTIRLRRIILCTRAGQAQAFRAIARTLPAPLVILEETTPLGTGGAILSALTQEALSDPFLVMNGDVLFAMDAAALVRAAAERGAALAAITVPDQARFGALVVKNGTVRSFREKRVALAPAPGLVNAGAYAFTHESLRGFDVKPCSFEHDIAPRLAARGRLAAVPTPGSFIDIGTPGDYAAAGAFVSTMARQDEPAGLKNVASPFG